MKRAVTCCAALILLFIAPLLPAQGLGETERNARQSRHIAGIWSQRLDQHRAILASADATRSERFAAIDGLRKLTAVTTFNTSEEPAHCDLQEAAVYLLLEQLDQRHTVDEEVSLAAADALYLAKTAAAPIVVRLSRAESAQGYWEIDVPQSIPCRQTSEAGTGKSVVKEQESRRIVITNPFVQIRLLQALRDYLVEGSDESLAASDDILDILIAVAQPDERKYPELMQLLALQAMGPNYLLKSTVEDSVRKAVYVRLASFVAEHGGLTADEAIRERAAKATKLLAGLGAIEPERETLVEKLLVIGLGELDHRIRLSALRGLAIAAEQSNARAELEMFLTDDGKLATVWETDPPNAELDGQVINIMTHLAGKNITDIGPAARANLVTLVSAGHAIERPVVQRGILKVEDALLAQMVEEPAVPAPTPAPETPGAEEMDGGEGAEESPPNSSATDGAGASATGASNTASEEMGTFFATDRLKIARELRVLATKQSSVAEGGAYPRFPEGATRGKRANYPKEGLRSPPPTGSGDSSITFKAITFGESTGRGAAGGTSVAPPE